MISYFPLNTPEEVKAVLQRYCNTGKSIRLWRGNLNNGQADMDVFNTRGFVGCSTGIWKAPILLATRSSSGGGMIEGNIVRIDDIGTHRMIYHHPSFHFPRLEIRYEPNLDDPVGDYWPWHVYANNKQIRGCKTEEQAKREVDYQIGKRYTL